MNSFDWPRFITTIIIFLLRARYLSSKEIEAEVEDTLYTTTSQEYIRSRLARLLITLSRELLGGEMPRHNVDIFETRTASETGVRGRRGQTSLWTIIGTRATLEVGHLVEEMTVHDAIAVAAAQVLVTLGLVMQEGIHLDAVIETVRGLLRGHVRRRGRCRCRRLDDVNRRPLVPGYLVVRPQRALRPGAVVRVLRVKVAQLGLETLEVDALAGVGREEPRHQRGVRLIGVAAVQLRYGYHVLQDAVLHFNRGGFVVERVPAAPRLHLVEHPERALGNARLVLRGGGGFADGILGARLETVGVVNFNGDRVLALGAARRIQRALSRAGGRAEEVGQRRQTRLRAVPALRLLRLTPIAFLTLHPLRGAHQGARYVLHEIRGVARVLPLGRPLALGGRRGLRYATGRTADPARVIAIVVDYRGPFREMSLIEIVRGFMQNYRLVYVVVQNDKVLAYVAGRVARALHDAVKVLRRIAIATTSRLIVYQVIRRGVQFSGGGVTYFLQKRGAMRVRQQGSTQWCLFEIWRGTGPTFAARGGGIRRLGDNSPAFTLMKRRRSPSLTLYSVRRY